MYRLTKSNVMFRGANSSRQSAVARRYLCVAWYCEDNCLLRFARGGAFFGRDLRFA